MSTSENFLAPRYWPWWLAIGILKLLVKLPYRTLLAIGRSIGRLLLFLPLKIKRTTLVNLQLCFPELTPAARRQLMRKNFESVGMGIMETALGWWASDAKIAGLLHMHNLNYLEEALQKGKGVIICGAHFTTLQIVGRLAVRELPLAVVYRPQKNPLLEKLNRMALEKHYKKAVARNNIRGVLQCLKANYCLWYTPDTDAGLKNSIFAPFFGAPAASVTATPRYAKISGAVLLPVAFYRREDGSGYDLTVCPPLENFPTQNLTQDVARINAVVEKVVRERPEQYIWQYKRFKTRPEGRQARIYR